LIWVKINTLFILAVMNKKSNSLLKLRLISSSVSIVISLSLVLYVIGLLAYILINTNSFSKKIKENITFSILLKDNAKEIDIVKFQKYIDAEDFAKNSIYITKDEATKNLISELGEDFTDFLGYSPLLASIDLKLKAEYTSYEKIKQLEAELMQSDIVHEIYYHKNLIQNINTNINKILMFLSSFCLLLSIISIGLINNSIRLSIYSKRFVIQTMSLVGAENWQIQKPFLIKSLIQGMYSSIFAIFLLIGSIQLIQKETASILNVNDFKLISFIFIFIFVSGLILSWLSTFFAVRKYIRIDEYKLYEK
tara:strand:- start:841 stop:1764 length:924 start_codon:yes stop_codon:yes gene_type:complete